MIKSFRVQRVPTHQDLSSLVSNISNLKNGVENWHSGIESKPSLKENVSSELSPYITGELAFDRQKELINMQNAFSAEQAEKARQFNIYMADTSYQRAVKDLRRAGLNPYLAYSAGGAPMSSSPSPSSSSATPPSDKVVEALSSSAEILSIIAKLVKKK